MADKKISALTGASTPLAGTEVLPIVQGGATVKVAVSDLTAGRAVSASSLSAESASIASSSTNSTTIGLDNTAAGGRNYIIYSSGGGPAAAGTWGIYDGTAGQNRFSMDSSGNVAVGVGNLVIGTSGKGIDFSATPGTGTSELLDDYEEGTWTPTQGANTTVVGTFTSSGTYTKVGRLVYVNGAMFGSTSISCTQNGQLCAGLPFTPVPGENVGIALNGERSATRACSAQDGGNAVQLAEAFNATIFGIYFAITYQV
jgi:hypothetical protein